MMAEDSQGQKFLTFPTKQAMEGRQALVKKLWDLTMTQSLYLKEQMHPKTSLGRMLHRTLKS